VILKNGGKVIDKVIMPRLGGTLPQKNGEPKSTWQVTA